VQLLCQVSAQLDCSFLCVAKRDQRTSQSGGRVEYLDTPGLCVDWPVTDCRVGFGGRSWQAAAALGTGVSRERMGTHCLAVRHFLRV